MDKLRRDVHTIFARHQAGLGSTTGASERLLRKALAPSATRPRVAPQIAAAAATLLIGAGVAYAVAITHGPLRTHGPTTKVGPSTSASASATAAPAPTPLAKALSVPSTTPVILYFDPLDPQQVDGITWDGTQRGRVGVFGGQAFGLLPNPAGTLYSTFRDIRDRNGQVVSPILGNSKEFGAWADDGRHYCQVVSASSLPPAAGEPATLRVVTVGSTARNVAQVGTMYQQSGAGVIACSTERDRAVVGQRTSVGTTVQVWVVQLSTGRILSTRSGNVVASRDGQYLAEGPPTGSSAWTVYDASGAVAGHVSGPVQAFSWDGSLVVVGEYGARSSVVEWRTGKVIWTSPAGTMFADVLPEPGGSRLAVGVETPGHPQTTGFPTVDVYAISPDGTAVQVLSNVSL